MSPSPSDFLEATLDSISVTNVGFILFLKVEEEPARALPIFIGANEAQSIALALGEEPPARPMTHDLLKAMLESSDATVTRVEITDLQEGTFFGRVYVSRGGFEENDFDARPSDAIALAVRFEAPIFVARKVFDEAAVVVKSTPGDSEEPPAEDIPEDAAPPEQAIPQSPLEKLRADLDAAVREERYEDAARLRDLLKRMSTGN